MSSIIPKKSLGQHWLKDSTILDKICSYAQISPGEFVIEIGPGLGTLTDKLLEAGANVTAVEFDENLASKLDQEKTSENLKVINQDILRFNFDDQQNGYKVVANIPYYLTGRLIRVLTESKNRPQKIVLLIQKEVAERICASPGKMSNLAIWSQTYFDCSLGIEVRPEMFEPPPKVMSQVVVLDLLPQPKLEEADKKVFTQITSFGFNNKRKTLTNSLSSGLSLNKEEIETVLNNAGLSKNSRPQELSIDKWILLAKNFNQMLSLG